jgi:hypothetical protein
MQKIHKLHRAIWLSFLMAALLFAALDPAIQVQAQPMNADAKCTSLTRTSPVPITDDLAFLKKSNVPLSALLPVAKIEEEYVTVKELAQALTKGGINEKDATTFLNTADNADHLISIVDFEPSRLLLKDAYKVFDTYGLHKNLMGQVASIGQDETALQALLNKESLSPSQVKGFITDARPLILKARQMGLIRFALTVSLYDTLHEAHFNGYALDVGMELNDADALEKTLIGGGVAAADLPALLKKIEALEKEGLSVELVEGWELRIVIGMLQSYGLPTTSVNALVAQPAKSDAVSACLKAFGLNADETQLFTTQLYRYVWDEGGHPFVTHDHILAYEDAEVAALLDKYGIHSDENLTAIFANVNNLPKLKAFLKNEGLSDDQIANVIIDLQGALFTATVDPADAAAFIKQFDQAVPKH